MTIAIEITKSVDNCQQNYLNYWLNLLKSPNLVTYLLENGKLKIGWPNSLKLLDY